LFKYFVGRNETALKSLGHNRLVRAHSGTTLVPIKNCYRRNGGKHAIPPYITYPLQPRHEAQVEDPCSAAEGRRGIEGVGCEEKYQHRQIFLVIEF